MDALDADIVDIALQDGRTLYVLAVFEPTPDACFSALYRHSLDEENATPVSPVFHASTWLTCVRPLREGVALGTADGELVLALPDSDVDVVEASARAISAIVEDNDTLIATTTAGEVLALRDGELARWKTGGPALFALASLDGALWVAGDSGYLARRDGDDWRAFETKTQETLNALVQTPEGVLAVGNNGSLVLVQGDRATLETAGQLKLTRAARWRGETLLAAGVDGLRQLGAASRIVREGPCHAVVAGPTYLAVSGEGTVFVSRDGVEWQSLRHSRPAPLD
ncbi:MAG: hypothetical protein KIT84_31305 [Labilithrix sp.]|nr:hypothetical protein [Labilithrix sp.]MCW5815557.1 hypothetical protein [Labilithrix sp.]